MATRHSIALVACPLQSSDHRLLLDSRVCGGGEAGLAINPRPAKARAVPWSRPKQLAFPTAGNTLGGIDELAVNWAKSFL